MKTPAILIGVTVVGLISCATTESDPVDEDLLSETQQAVTSTTRVTSTLVGKGEWHTIVRLPPIALTTGQQLYLTGGWRPRSNTEAKILQGVTIMCSVNGEVIERSTSSNINHHSTTGPLYSATRWLFKAPRTASYRCELKGRACSIPSCDDETRMLLVNDTEVHAISATPADPGDVAWAAPDLCVAPGATEKVMARKWDATSDARTIDVDLALEVTTALDAPNWLDKFCDGFYKDASGTTVSGRLVVVQLDAGGQPCAPQVQTDIKKLFVSAATHHDKMHLTLRDVPVSTASGCTRRFSIYGVVSASGSTLYLQLQDFSTGIARSQR
ncbi:MAG: hypothetical protein AB7O24_17365 [Kofleriaceae bacterium]